MEGIREALTDQMHRANRMFRQAVEACPASEWHKGDIPYLRPAGLAIHVVETIEFYAGEVPAGVFVFGHRFGIDWENAESEQFPDQEALLAYLDQVEQQVDEWLANADLLAPEKTFPWTGPNGLGRMIYLLRNTQHHLAEICLELTRRGHKAPDWA